MGKNRKASMKIMRKFLFFCFLLVFAFVWPVVAEDEGFTDWAEDLAYILSFERLENAEKWLDDEDSPYECEVDEKSKEVVCDRITDKGSVFDCSIVFKHNEQDVKEMYAKCVTKKNVKMADYFDELSEAVTTVQDNFVSLHGLRVTQDDWEIIVDNLYKWNKKIPRFNYWLIDDKVVFATQKSDKETAEVGLTCKFARIIFALQRQFSYV